MARAYSKVSEREGRREREIYRAQERFLTVRAQCGNDARAYQEAHVTWRTVKKWKDEDELGFRERYRAALEEYADLLEDILDQHIKALKPGQNILSIIFALKAVRPEKYRELAHRPSEGAWELVRALMQMKGAPSTGAMPPKAILPVPTTDDLEEEPKGQGLSIQEQVDQILRRQPDAS